MLIAEEILNHEKKGEELVFLDPEVQKFTLKLSKIGLTREERTRKYLNSLKSKIAQRG